MAYIEKKIDGVIDFILAQTDEERAAAIENLRNMRIPDPNDVLDPEIIRKVTLGILVDLGIPAHQDGRTYLQEAVVVAIQEGGINGVVTKVVYPCVARTCNTSSTAVERSIRASIMAGWKRCNIEAKRKYFGSYVAGGDRQPTNAHFIARIAEVVMERLV